MNLPKELTTVTRLSKAIAFIMLIFLPIIGFFLGIKYQASLTSNGPLNNDYKNSTQLIPTAKPNSSTSFSVSTESSTTLCKDKIADSPTIPDNIRNASFIYVTKNKTSGKGQFSLRKTIDSPDLFLLDTGSSYRFSRDNSKIAYMESAPTVFIYDISSKQTSSIQLHGKKNGDEFEFFDEWSPDNKYLLVAMSSAPPGRNDLYEVSTGNYVTTVNGYHFWLNDSLVIEENDRLFEKAPRPWGSGNARGFGERSIPSDSFKSLFIPTETIDYELNNVGQSTIYYSKNIVENPQDWNYYPDKVQKTYWKCDKDCLSPIQISESDIPNSWHETANIIKNSLPKTFTKEQYTNTIQYIDYNPSYTNWVLFSLSCGTSAYDSKTTLVLINLQNPNNSLRIVGEGTDSHWIK